MIQRARMLHFDLLDLDQLRLLFLQLLLSSLPLSLRLDPFQSRYFIPYPVRERYFIT